MMLGPVYLVLAVACINAVYNFVDTLRAINHEWFWPTLDP